MKENEGAKATSAASSPPGDPAGGVADGGHRLGDRPGVTCPSATALRNWPWLIQW